MCGIGKCPTCGDMSYECGVWIGGPNCGCFRDFSDMTRKAFMAMLKRNKAKLNKRTMKFIEVHGFKGEGK